MYRVNISYAYVLVVNQLNIYVWVKIYKRQVALAQLATNEGKARVEGTIVGVGIKGEAFIVNQVHLIAHLGHMYLLMNGVKVHVWQLVIDSSHKNTDNCRSQELAFR